jgi:hypothetical protein
MMLSRRTWSEAEVDEGDPGIDGEEDGQREDAEDQRDRYGASFPLLTDVQIQGDSRRRSHSTANLS